MPEKSFRRCNFFPSPRCPRVIRDFRLTPLDSITLMFSICSNGGPVLAPLIFAVVPFENGTNWGPCWGKEVDPLGTNTHRCL